MITDSKVWRMMRDISADRLYTCMYNIYIGSGSVIVIVIGGSYSLLYYWSYCNDYCIVISCY